jgi:hypothetical protein
MLNGTTDQLVEGFFTGLQRKTAPIDQRIARRESTKLINHLISIGVDPYSLTDEQIRDEWVKFIREHGIDLTEQGS